MSICLRNCKFLRNLSVPVTRLYLSDSGNIRDAGGKWKEREAAFEEQHFRRKNQEDLERLRRKLKKKKRKKRDRDDHHEDCGDHCEDDRHH